MLKQHETADGHMLSPGGEKPGTLLALYIQQNNAITPLAVKHQRRYSAAEKPPEQRLTLRQ